MPITPVQNNSPRDADGYELDTQGNRIYPHWAGFVPPGAKTTGATRPPWVPSIANYWDESKPPRGWFKCLDGSWGNIGDEEHVKAHPELNGLMIDFLKKEEAQQPSEEALTEAQDRADAIDKQGLPATKKDVVAPEPTTAGIKCGVCERPFPNPASLRAHMNHHKKSDQHHADAAKEEVTQ